MPWSRKQHSSDPQEVEEELLFSQKMEKMEVVMSSETGKSGLGYEEMVWIRDKDGREYACQFNEIKFIKRREDLTSEEVNRCVDVSQILDKDNW
jgi:hypothetical protein